MKVLFDHSDRFFLAHGGFQVQIEGTKAGLEARGVAKDAIKPGDHIIVEGYPSRDNLDHRLFMRGITRPSDGWKSGKDIK